jgi:hypothetical protein
MQETGNQELAYPPNLKLENFCRTIVEYGQGFFEWIAWQGYQTSGRGVISIDLDGNETDPLKVGDLSWKPLTAPDLAILWEHSTIAYPLLKKTFELYRQSIETYDPMSEYVVLLTTPTQLCCLKELSFWASQTRQPYCSRETDNPVKEMTRQWIETFNEQHQPIESNP